MTLVRRRFLKLAAGTAAMPAMPWIARAQAYPARPVRLMVGFGAGTPLDIVARLIAQWLSERLGQAFVVENRPGGATNLAAQAVVRSPADGYTLLMCSSTNAINATLYPNLDFSFAQDIAPVAGLIVVPNVMLVNLAVPASTVPEFIAYAKANRGKINMVSVGTGTMPHVSGELFNLMAGIDMVPVQYRGTPPALADLLGGQVQVYFAGSVTAVELVKGGKLRGLAVTTAKRSEALPDVPAVGEFLPGYESSLWFGVGAPKNTPVEIVDRLNKEINAGLADAKIKASIVQMGGTALLGSPADFGRHVAGEIDKWGKVVKFANIKAE
jgi:tripartite-type tricarboxylate transporter receptor subunit TctC